MLSGKFLSLSCGYFALIDEEDFNRASRHKWCTVKNRADGIKYAIGKKKENGKRKTIHLHRFIMNAKKGEEIDHINHDGLDNRKSNLRICSSSQNAMNRRKKKGCCSIYKGVTFWTERGKWKAQITNKKKCINLGLYELEKEAALSYNKAAKKMFGEFAYLNTLARQ